MRTRHLAIFVSLLVVTCGGETDGDDATVTSAAATTATGAGGSGGHGGAGGGAVTSTGGSGGATTTGTGVMPPPECVTYEAKAQMCFPGANEDFYQECLDLFELCGGRMPAVVECRIDTPCADLADCQGLAC